MNTMLADRLFSDPRLRALGDRLRCPFRALGLLGNIWHGTQNLGRTHVELAQLLNSFPAGARRDTRLIDALVSSGWLVKHGEMYEVVGSVDHVQKRDTLSENGKKGAAARWGKKDGQAISEANAETMPSHLTSSPLTSPLPKERGEAPAAPRPLLDTESPARKTKLVEPAVLADFERLTKAAGRELGNFDEGDHRLAGKIYAKRPKDWQAVMRSYVADPRYQFAGWSLKWLAANIDEVAAKIGTTPYAKPAKAGEMKSLVPAATTLLERIDEDRQQASSDESRKAAKAALDSIHAQLDKRKSGV